MDLNNRHPEAFLVCEKIFVGVPGWIIFFAEQNTPEFEKFPHRYKESSCFIRPWFFLPRLSFFRCFPRSAERSEDEYVQQEKRRKIDELVRVETELLRLKLDAQATVHFLVTDLYDLI
jgi:hypothetical protein